MNEEGRESRPQSLHQKCVSFFLSREDDSIPYIQNESLQSKDGMTVPLKYPFIFPFSVEFRDFALFQWTHKLTCVVL